MAILFAFGGIQRRKGRRIMNANHPVLIFGIKNQPKTFMAVHFRDETQIRRIVRITVCVRKAEASLRSSKPRKFLRSVVINSSFLECYYYLHFGGRCHNDTYPGNFGR